MNKFKKGDLIVVTDKTDSLFSQTGIVSSVSGEYIHAEMIGTATERCCFAPIKLQVK